MAIHLPLLAWAGVGAFLVAGHRDPVNRFTFLIKSLEVFIFGGLFLLAGVVFTGITTALFAALDVEFPDAVMRLFIAGGVGLVAVVAVAVMYNPTLPPAEQAFNEGLSKLVALLMRLMLPLTLLVLLVYVAFIPFNFRAPFDNRDVLIVYNLMLFAVVALLVGATPVSLTGISPRLARWLRLGIMAVAALALLVSLYALAAILYRTAFDRLTPNRLTFIGWNLINIGLLILLLFFQMRVKEGRWLAALYRAYSAGTVAYAVWTIVVILALPWLFGADQEALSSLPVTVQEIIYDKPDPILLKCGASPHIYLMDQGQKRWIDTIETFNDRGYVWRDVHFVSCADLRSIPDGAPIPADAGPAPQP
jgi:magnesium-transporting ATPase (P-type)